MENSTQESHLRQENSVTYESPYPLYAMAFASPQTRTRHQHHLIAVGSFIEEYSNRVDILSLDPDTLSIKLNPTLSFDHPYPPTKLMFHPNPNALHKTNELIASSGDYLRLSVEPIQVLNNSKTSEFCAPLTSFDWNDIEPRRIGTSSIDTTCTIWDIEKGVVETQLVLHDKELRLAWDKPDLRYTATILMDSNKVVILDI